MDYVFAKKLSLLKVIVAQIWTSKLHLFLPII